jgi:hypothetical protein
VLIIWQCRLKDPHKVETTIKQFLAGPPQSHPTRKPNEKARPVTRRS